MKSAAISLISTQASRSERRSGGKCELILCKPERPADAGLKGFSFRFLILFIISKMNSAEVGYTLP